MTNCDKIRYGALMEELDNGYIKCKDNKKEDHEYPESMVDAYTMCANYRKFEPKPKQNNTPQTQLSFAQQNSNRNNKNLICDNCGEEGHITPTCTKPRNEANIQRNKSRHLN